MLPKTNLITQQQQKSEQEGLWYPNLDPNFFFGGQYYCKADRSSILEQTDIQPLHNDLWQNLFSEVGQCCFTAAKKSLFPLFRDTRPLFAMKIAHQNEKLLTPSDVFQSIGPLGRCFL